jgi:hypothetical protein
MVWNTTGEMGRPRGAVFVEIGFGGAREVIVVRGGLGVRFLPSALIALRLLCARTFIVAAQAAASGRTLTAILVEY